MGAGREYETILIMETDFMGENLLRIWLKIPRMDRERKVGSHAVVHAFSTREELKEDWRRLTGSKEPRELGRALEQVLVKRDWKNPDKNTQSDGRRLQEPNWPIDLLACGGHGMAWRI